jgi:GTPase SAR1 family protein
MNGDVELVHAALEPISPSSVTSSGSRLQDDVELQIWWTAGQERFGALHSALTRGAIVWYLCFEHRPTLDLCDAESINSHCQDALAQLEPWLHNLSTASALYPAPVLPVLLGLKSDVLRRSATRRGLKDADEDDCLEDFNYHLCAMASRAICSTIVKPELFHPLRCFHVSSKTNEGIEELMQYTADTIRATVHRFPRGVSSVYPSGWRAGAVKLPLPKEVPSSAESSTWCSCS